MTKVTSKQLDKIDKITFNTGNNHVIIINSIM